jgi:hypothetical protein
MSAQAVTYFSDATPGKAEGVGGRLQSGAP